MHLLDLTLEDPAENLALDEALLEQAESDGSSREVLRLWEPTDTAVIVGRSSRVADEVNLDWCRRLDIPILRRCSGGASIVTGRGCLMYGVVLSVAKQPALRLVEHAHRFVLGRLKAALATMHSRVELVGISDLALDGKKFSGNSLRCKRSHLLYHGTLLYDFPLDIIQTCLNAPPRQPDYREGRSHKDFLVNLTGASSELKSSLIQAWNATTALANWPEKLTHELADRRYRQAAWNYRH